MQYTFFLHYISDMQQMCHTEKQNFDMIWLILMKVDSVVLLLSLSQGSHLVFELTLEFGGS